MYEFSAPMPFEKKLIDNYLVINDKVEKSKIKSLYFALPANSTDCSGFEQLRVYTSDLFGFEYWAEIIKYSMDKGFDFVYLLNSPKSFLSESKMLDIQLEKLDRLLTKLKSVGVYKLRVANTQLLNYIIQKYPEFKLYASTSFEYMELKQFNNFLTLFPQIVEIVPSFDVNKNFTLLKNLRTKFPCVDIELMVNEGCISGCPFRIHHFLSVPTNITETYMKRSSLYTMDYFVKTCNEYYYNNLFEQICLSNIIYPWEISEYEKIGINKFKLVGRNDKNFNTEKYADYYLTYLKGIDDYKNIENENFRSLNHYIYGITNLNIKIKDIKKYLPNIMHFVKNGHMCASICGSQCKYCYECADNIKTKLNL